MSSLVLASGSPRRREILTTLGVLFSVDAADIDESPRPGEAPTDYVRRLSIDKAVTVAARCAAGAVVVAADTTVDLDGRILGKPDSAEDARSMLRALSATTHQVHTGVTVLRGPAIASDVATTAVTFDHVTAEVLEWYVSTGEPFGKAGAYAIQGAGGLLVERVEGSVSNVVGLPLTLLSALLRRIGVALVGPDSA